MRADANQDARTCQGFGDRPIHDAWPWPRPGHGAGLAVTATSAREGLGNVHRERPNYDLRASQVEMPQRVVKFFWELVHGHRHRLGTVLDMGGGDGKFASYGHFVRYEGVEIDSARITDKRPRKNASVVQGCVFAQPHQAYDACIGNPPYLRHQDIESPWKERTLEMLSAELDVELSGQLNSILSEMRNLHG